MVLTKRDPDELTRASEQRTAKSVIDAVRALAQAAGITETPSAWYGILRVAFKDVFLRGERYAHEIPTMRDTRPGFPAVTEEVTRKIRTPR